MKTRNQIAILLGTCFLLSLSSCSLFYKDESEDDYNLFIIGQKNQSEGEYNDAKKVYEKLIEDYPDSKLRAKAILALADTLFNKGDYVESEIQYQKFIELYPNHEHIDKAYFYKGMSHYSQMKDLDRDPTQIKHAYDTFGQLVENYKESPYAAEAAEKREECRKRLAEQTMSIAKFYFGIGAYGSAINRAVEYITKYNDGAEADYALYMIGESNRLEGNSEKAKYWYQKLIETFPDSSYAKSSKSTLEDIERKEKK